MRVIIPRKIATIATLFLIIENIAWGETPTLPGSTMPENVSKSLLPRKQPTATALPPVVSTPQPSETPGGEEAKKIKFLLKGVVLEGNQVYSKEQLLPLYQKNIGKVISVADLFGIVQDITNFYRNNGYIISRAILPPQHVKGGVVHIRIIEGYIDGVEVTGDPKWAKCNVLAIGEQIKACPPLQLSNMEKYLFIENEIPGAQVRAVLSPSKTKTGAADLSLQTTMKSVGGYLSYDNYGTRYIGPQQITANLVLNSFARSGDSTQITFTKTPKGIELAFFDINYNVPISDTGARVTGGATRAETHPLFVLQPTQIEGLNTNYYLTFSFPIIRERAQALTVQTGFNYLDTTVNTFGQELYTDHLRNFSLGMYYNFSDRYLGANSVYVDWRQGLPILGYSSNINPQTALTSRPGGHGDYTKFDVQLSRLQAIKGNFSLYGAARGLYSFSPLLASEQFTWGGSQMGRGYDVAELIGDKGIGGTLELRYDWNIGQYIQSFEPYIFYDAGMIWNYLFIGGTPRVQSATSTGAGLRFYFTKYLSGNVFWAQPLTKEVAAEQLIGDGWRPRVFFSVVLSM